MLVVRPVWAEPPVWAGRPGAAAPTRTSTVAATSLPHVLPRVRARTERRAAVFNEPGTQGGTPVWEELGAGVRPVECCRVRSGPRHEVRHDLRLGSRLRGTAGYGIRTAAVRVREAAAPSMLSP
ncbi:hypothetical protein GCM10010430_28090 [Kitasatospora cystarginea]|uniref:Secreted protein n=1 Tax=Kitasatospora cystarginea TaxID=58350 RepID=A0ABN3DYR3_9ACTN